ncbi:MAG: bifunctional DNA-formamidopyrimidine glycosylase/DNA-(apurinic or apyrimidinic site) lyase [Pseudomonadales bacterium]|nr:bifunctional DNA-formamidopyrimidine glycosylase/DNA-(apurinic or apyrimidinic site) lyase [Pseudomonadales bacterium]MBO6703355.1 bifunctional DNA-formamidopyrimidine glycosylase/DNA-(apurinic or apyrimidinic site) lyase [Pseudomonadales bacterium]MBO7004462.1 bifunctional DNA-formamidopyrimidine glycosylase/DNA-(apurinic or apyrimidinic site) lyase [Pseudomonadales bacterium]
MPELPEVETTRRGIEPHVVGKSVKNVLVRQASLRWPVSPELGQVLTGQMFSGIDRRAKYLLFKTPVGKMMVHLGMSGSLRIASPDHVLKKHDHIDLVFSDDTILRYHDPRRFGSVFWLPGESSHELLDHLGPEPLSSEFNARYLYDVSRKRKVSVKLFIMNSKVVVGVGNIYANEALHSAGIRPDRLASRISLPRYEKLVEEIKAVLMRSIKSGGTTLRDFVREDGSPGYFKQKLNVYGRGNEACRQCGKDLKEIRQGNRSTVFCPACQK